MAEAEQVRQRAMETDQLSAANTAIRGKAVLSGQWIERREVGPPESFDHLTDDELERALVERIRALGLTLDVDEKAAAYHLAPDAESDTQH
jgi:hypothetical protein